MSVDLPCIEEIDGLNLTVAHMLELVLRNAQGEIVMPNVNHHWFQGEKATPIRDLLNTVGEQSNLEALNRDMRFMVFKRVRGADVRKKHPKMVPLFHNTGYKMTHPDDLKLALPCTEGDKEAFVNQYRAVEGRLKGVRGGYTVNDSYFIAPMDGLHRMMVLDMLRKNDQPKFHTVNKCYTLSAKFHYAHCTEGELVTYNL